MTIKRILFRSVVRSLEWFTLLQRPRRTINLTLAKVDEKEAIDIVVIAFNNPELIRIQYQFLLKFIKDEFNYIVADNSTNLKARKDIEAFCRENEVAYISLPTNHLNRIGTSYSHACALNYVYRQVIRKRKPYAFGQIDHDLFPIQKVSILDYLKDQPVYGPLRKRNECWYLSAIMSFFLYDYVCDKKVDFMPVTPYQTYLDSGGGNWYDIYSRLNLDQLHFAQEHIEELRKGGDRHGDSLEYFDNKKWLHTINGSCWKKVEAGKEDLIRLLLNNYLQSC